MRGEIANLLLSDDWNVVADIFEPNFHNYGNWIAFLNTNLHNGSVAGQISAPATKWTIEAFHALFVACWIHHPVEKGSFMIDLQGMSPAQYEAMKDKAFDKKGGCLGIRWSSHLEGKARSAGKGWAFLKGYHELLVQKEKTKGRRHLFLKSEGHSAFSFAHINSYFAKQKSGAGLTASDGLNQAAKMLSHLIEARAAENFGNGYKEVLKQLKLKGNMVTVREMIPVLFSQAGYRPAGKTPQLFAQTATNTEIGIELGRFCDSQKPGLLHVPAADGPRNLALSEEAISDLRMLAKTLINDSDNRDRVFREIRATPEEIDASLHRFRTIPNGYQASRAAELSDMLV